LKAIKYLNLKEISKKTAEALSSDSWLMISSFSVEHVLQAGCLKVSELEKAKALLRWFVAQNQTFGDVEEKAMLKSKVELFLGQVDFAAFSKEEFAALCESDLHCIMDKSEMYDAIVRFCLNDWETKPLTTPWLKDIKSFTSVLFPFSSIEQDVFLYESFWCSLRFEVSHRVALVGVATSSQNQLELLSSTINWEDFQKFKFYITIGEDTEKLAEGSSDIKCLVFGKECVAVTPKIVLDAGTRYRMRFNFPNVLKDTKFPRFVLNTANVNKHHFNLTFHTPKNCCNVTELIFSAV
jgi:hypothetical protein